MASRMPKSTIDWAGPKRGSAGASELMTPSPRVRTWSTIDREMAIRSSDSASTRNRTCLTASSPASPSASRIAPRSAPMESSTSWRIWGRSASTSSTVLMAWVVRYRVARLPRRTLSHSPADAGASSTREPSLAGMLRMIAERSSGLARLRRSTREVRSRAVAPAASW